MTPAQRRFARFSMVGIIGAALQISLIYLLAKCCGLRSFVATPLAVEMALVHNFIWHQRFTWKERGAPNPRLLRRLCSFHAGNGLISLSGNTLLMYLLAERLNLPPAPSSLAAIVLCSVANFLVADRWVFGRATPLSSAALPATSAR